MHLQLFFPLLASFLMLANAALVVAQELPTNSAGESVEVEPPFSDASMRAELQRLADICERIGLPSEAEYSRNWLPLPRDDQTVLYLAEDGPSATAPQSTNQAHWRDSFVAIRHRYADFLFEKVQQLAGQGLETEAFQLLWQVHREHPQHSASRRALGAFTTALTRRPQMRTVTTIHPNFAWPARSYSQIRTTHFNLLTRADRRASLELAQQLERFYCLWSQIFYPLWAAPGQLQQRLAGSAVPWDQPEEIQVVLLRDRQEYLQLLGASEANIGVSVGYYAPDSQTSFFYPDDNLTATLFHELTHQLLAEATHLEPSHVGETGGLWLVEGIAMYMESLNQRGSYWTIGGLESPRLQTARYRAVRDGYWPDWSEFTQGNLDSWKKSPELSRLYTHAAGLAHLFLDQLLEEAGAREAFFKALVDVYQGGDGSLANTPRPLLNLLAANEQQAKRVYQTALTLSDEDLHSLRDSGHQVQDLVLAGSQLTPQTWQTLDNQAKLQWLDLSFTNITDEQLKWLPLLKELNRLSVEGTPVEGSFLKQLNELQALAELDLARCAIDDQKLSQLAGLGALETLWLTLTPVTDAALETLDALPALRQCDIQGTAISSSSWQTFLRDHPRLQE
ncbi:leucine-rich repeat domain-containing protein [Aureliella helgolandensis]|uniref:Leucine Rich repeats (2 copies) n=1 Tax=Aureliella helgolandensis TaxID=2527968 RepID=A0A518G1E3_9BACT|nr:hypothetical protein [Aureliella helgolandensis]QDV22403.1 Leucine Rich repeats (2 copies) [Aureliella helgolandensis]